MTKQQGEDMPMQTKWKIVPVEPTEYMLKAACIAPNGTKRGKLGDLLRIEYTAMLSAAPPCEDLETVSRILSQIANSYVGAPIETEACDAYAGQVRHDQELAAEALAALGRIRGEG